MKVHLPAGFCMVGIDFFMQIIMMTKKSTRPCKAGAFLFSIKL